MLELRVCINNLELKICKQLRPKMCIQDSCKELHRTMNSGAKSNLKQGDDVQFICNFLSHLIYTESKKYDVGTADFISWFLNRQDKENKGIA